MNFRLKDMRFELMPAVGVVVLLGACSSVSTKTPEGSSTSMSREEFADYVETTFRHHNAVVNELITASSLGDEEAFTDPVLIRAEEEMAAACRPLNDVVTATIEKRELSFWTKLQLPNQVPQCAAASRHVETLIPEY